MIPSAENLPLRHGMRHEPQIRYCLGNFLERKCTFTIEPPTGAIRVAGSVEKVDDVAAIHQREFSAMRGQEIRELLHESLVVAPNLRRNFLRWLGNLLSLGHDVLREIARF
jgi:hypothetical protein